MNRTIKFRGKRVDNGEWIYGSLNIEYDGTCFVSFWVSELMEPENNYSEMVIKSFEVIPETVGQFIGLYDKNGKEIYEGDILVDQGGTSGIVSWNKDDCSFSVNCHDYLFENLYSDDSKYFTITGNIHDND